MSARYSILQSFGDPMHFVKKLFESAGRTSNYKKISLHAFMALVHSTFPEKEALKVSANHTHWDPLFNSSIPYRDRKEGEKRIALHKSRKTLLVDNIEKLGNSK